MDKFKREIQGRLQFFPLPEEGGGTMGEIIQFAVFGAVDANQSFLVDYFLDLEAFLSVLGFSGMGENPLSKEASAKIKAILSSAFLVFP